MSPGGVENVRGEIMCGIYNIIRGESKFETVVNACLAVVLLFVGGTLAVFETMINPMMSVFTITVVVLLLLRSKIGQKAFAVSIMVVGSVLPCVVLVCFLRGGRIEEWTELDEVGPSLWAGGTYRDPCGPLELMLFISILLLMAGGYMLVSMVRRRV